MKKYGLIGKSLGHSFSKSFFTTYFKEKGIDAVYENIELNSSDQIPGILINDYSGLNVTIPYKEAIIPYLDELSDEAKAIGAVNTVQFFEGRSVGHNTDGFGFHQSIKPFLRNIHERAIVFGDGGAAKAVIYVLKKLGINIVNVVRNPGEGQFGYDEVNEHMFNACKLVVNCTPVGTYPNVNDKLPIPFNYFTEDHLVVDLIYNPERTYLLKCAEEHGAMVLNGSSMLKEQALKAWEIWNR